MRITDCFGTPLNTGSYVAIVSGNYIRSAKIIDLHQTFSGSVRVKYAYTCPKTVRTKTEYWHKQPGTSDITFQTALIANLPIEEVRRIEQFCYENNL